MAITTAEPTPSENDSAGLAALSPDEIAIHHDSAGDDRKDPPLRWTILAAVLGHVLLLALLVIDWRSRPDSRPAPKPIPIQLVMLPPKPEPAPEPPPSPKAPTPELKSGPEQETTAPPPAEAEGPKASPPPEAPPTVEEKPPVEQPPPTPLRAVPQWREPVGTAKPKPNKLPVPVEAPKEAPVAMGPRIVSLSPPGRRPAEVARSGDPYLNTLRDLIERNRSYPPLELFHSMRAAIAVYQVVVDRSGTLMGVRMLQSTGVSKLDETAGLMIRDAAPFPPLPSHYPELRAVITFEIPIFPEPH